MVYGEFISAETRGFSDIINITGDVQTIVGESHIKNGIANIFVTGSTASISTIEFEPALVEDYKEQIDRLIPHDLRTRHSETWGDDNGFSHIRATLMGPGIVVPVKDGKLVLGTWQQIVVIDHDNRNRNRRIFVQCVGE